MTKTNVMMSINQVNILTFKHLAPDNIAHGFFGRQGGVSTGVYSSLNCSPQSRDDAGHIAENRELVLKVLGGGELSTLKQMHSPICFPVGSSCTRGIEEGDALVTKTPGQVIGCLTADCGPVLFYGTGGRDNFPVIGAAHAGWGGALKGVLESTINAMVKMGADIKTIRAAIGPCIGEANYEVAADFKIPFLREDKKAVQFFKLKPDGKFLFDLQGYIKFRLNRAGVQKTITANRDTYAMEADYFSFRRTTHRGEADYGRQISAISIRRT